MRGVRVFLPAFRAHTSVYPPPKQPRRDRAPLHNYRCPARLFYPLNIWAITARHHEIRVWLSHRVNIWDGDDGRDGAVVPSGRVYSWIWFPVLFPWAKCRNGRRVTGVTEHEGQAPALGARSRRSPRPTEPRDGPALRFTHARHAGPGSISYTIPQLKLLFSFEILLWILQNVYSLLD